MIAAFTAENVEEMQGLLVPAGAAFQVSFAQTPSILVSNGRVMCAFASFRTKYFSRLQIAVKMG